MRDLIDFVFQVRYPLLKVALLFLSGEGTFIQFVEGKSQHDHIEQYFIERFHTFF